MTVAGFVQVNGTAFAWADSDVLRDGAVVGKMVKLVVSPIGVVAIGTGYADMLAKLLEHVKGGAGVSTLPGWLRERHAAKRQHARSYDYRYEAQSSYAVITAERAVVFREARDFESEERDFWTSPNVNLRPRSAAEIIETAQLQLNFVRVENRHSTGGELRIAKVGPDRVVQTSVPLLI
jgi:hypothetical protein